MTERELIAAIRARLAREDRRIELGIGDDAALLAGGSIVSVDALVEGVHFDRRWLTWEDVGFKAYAAALSDLAAMGAAPVAGLSALILPRELEDAAVLAIVDGIAEAADAFDAPIAGGNVSSGGVLSITSTVIGRADRPITRSGARVGDGIYVTGPLGMAALGWRLLARGETKEPFATRWRRPRPRFDLAPQVAAIATSAIDVSDGLLADLDHVCRASGVGAAIDIDEVPVAAHQLELARSIGEDGLELALTGGEDYELAFTSADDDQATKWGARIGTIVERSSASVVDREGRAIDLARRGYEHR
jgi:thiamine-monophosphate kinase